MDGYNKFTRNKLLCSLYNIADLLSGVGEDYRVLSIYYKYKDSRTISILI